MMWIVFFRARWSTPSGPAPASGDDGKTNVKGDLPAAQWRVVL